MYRVDIDSDLCSGFAACVDVAPEIFKLDDAGTATLLVTETDDQLALKAAKDCPMAAIAVFDVESGERVD
jgi:ferredoxin